MPQDLITVSLCGRKYEVPKDILIKSKYFKNIFKEFPEQKELFIPRSPLAFDQVLSFLVDDNYTIPHKFKQDVDFYLLEGVKYEDEDLKFNLLNKKIDDILNETNKMKKDSMNIAKDIEFANMQTHISGLEFDECPKCLSIKRKHKCVCDKCWANKIDNFK